MIQSEIFALQSIDYAPFSRKNLLLVAYQKFCKRTAIDMQPMMNGRNAVKIAINKVIISCLKQSIPEPLRGTIVNTASKSGHGWLHLLFPQLFLEHSARILVSPLADMKGLMTETDEWLRRSTRTIYWKHWKKVKTRYRNLRALLL